MFAEESFPPVQKKWAENKLNRWRFLKRFSTDENMRYTVEDTMFYSSFDALKRIIKKTRNYVDKYEFYEKLIHRTIPRNYVSDTVEKITYLLDLGTDVNAINPSSGFSILHNVCYSAEVRYRNQFIQELLNRGVDINSIDKNGYTPFYYSMIRMNYPIMKFLLQKGADMNIRTIYKKTLLFEFTNYFLKNNEKNYIDNIEIDKYKEMIRFLIKHGADMNEYCKCECGHSSCEYTLLLYLCSHVMQNKHNEDDIYKNNYILKMISTLIKNGANVNATVTIDNEVNTPLSIAVYNRNIPIVELLLVYEPFIPNHVLDYLERSQDEDNRRIAEMIDNHISILQEQPMRKRRRLC